MSLYLFRLPVAKANRRPCGESSSPSPAFSSWIKTSAALHLSCTINWIFSVCLWYQYSSIGVRRGPPQRPKKHFRQSDASEGSGGYLTRTIWAISWAGEQLWQQSLIISEDTNCASQACCLLFRSRGPPEIPIDCHDKPRRISDDHVVDLGLGGSRKAKLRPSCSMKEGPRHNGVASHRRHGHALLSLPPDRDHPRTGSILRTCPKIVRNLPSLSCIS